jgi:hypothetical protein
LKCELAAREGAAQHPLLWMFGTDRIASEFAGYGQLWGLNVGKILEHRKLLLLANHDGSQRAIGWTRDAVSMIARVDWSEPSSIRWKVTLGRLVDG